MVNLATIEIVTHDGPFHADDVLAVAILSSIYKRHNIIRTRDKETIDKGDFVVDVGTVYDHELRRYDHHMRNPPSDNRGHVYSSAGLIWKHYAKSYLNSIDIPATHIYEKDTLDIHGQVIQIMKYRWINPIDLNDNGVLHSQTPISDTISALSPILGQKNVEGYNEQFQVAVDLVGMIFKRACFHAVEKIIKQYQLNSSKPDYLLDGKIMVSQYEVYNFKYFSEGLIHFVIYPVADFRNEGSRYYVIRPIYDSTTGKYKTPIPNHLLGLDSEELEKLGFKDVLFVHHSGFMVRTRTVSAAMGFCEHLLDTRSH